MSSTQPARAASVSLDQLIAFNDEIVSLVRVGVPLEEGLALVGGELPGPSGRLAQWVAERMQQGQPLEQVLADHPESFPPVYRAVVQAGLKSGRLAAALEAVAASSRRLSQARRMIAAGIIYPLLVFLVGWGLFVFYTVKLAGSFLQVVDDFGLPGRGFFAMLSEWGQTAGYWGPAAPVAILLLAGLWWASSGRASLAEPGMAGALLGWLPGMRRMLRNYQVATFADLLALLAEHGVPLAEAMVLAADAIGGRRLKDAAGQIAVAVQRGESLAPNTPGMGQLPPLLVWLMSRGQADGSLPSALRQAAEIYHQRAFYQSEALRVFTPVFLTLVIGGGITFSYALLVLGSWITILKGLSYVS